MNNAERPFRRSSYYDLRERFKVQSQQHRDFLDALDYELSQRHTPFAIQLRREIIEEIERLKK